MAIAGFSVEIAADGEGEATLSEALFALSRAVEAPVVLIVDEAQIALASEAGVTAMFAVKAARDAVQARPGGGRKFGLVLTGGDRDKLADLVRGRDQPFFGASVTDFPLLGRDYVDAYTAWLNTRLAAGNQIDPDAAAAAFDLLGRRPELLQEVLRETALSGPGSEGLKDAVRERADGLRSRLWRVYETDCGQLSALQMAVLEQVAVEGARLAPFSQRTCAFIAKETGAAAPTSTASIQSALDTLRTRGLVWRSARGDYALEDQGLAEWLRERGSDSVG